MEELEYYIKLLKKIYQRQTKINDKSRRIAKWIYILEQAYNILVDIREIDD